MPAQICVDLSPKDNHKLQQAVKSRTSAPRLVLRAQIVLLAGESLPNAEIAGRLGVNIHTVRLWRNRYIAEGFKGLLKDRARGRNHGGKNTVGQEKLRQAIIAKTTQEKPAGATHWSTRTMAKVIDPFLCEPCLAAGRIKTALVPHLQGG